jgi:hypothetical protein
MGTIAIPTPSSGYARRRATLRIERGRRARAERRHRLTGALLMCLLSVSMLAAAAVPGILEADPVLPAQTVAVKVAPGETLWSIAADHAPEGVPTSRMVEAISDLNGLDTGGVPAGAVIHIPSDRELQVAAR